LSRNRICSRSSAILQFVVATGAGDVYGNILEQAALGRRTFRIRGFKQQYSGVASACRFQVCRAGMPEPRHGRPIVSPLARAYIRCPARRGRCMTRRECSPKAKELPMVEVIEREAVGEAIEATVNYIVDNGEKIFTQTTAPGSTDIRSGGTLDPHRVTIRN